MKIRKHGNQYTKEKPERTESFKCDNCDCEFSVKEDEYYTDYGGADNNSWTIGTSCTYTISAVIKDYLVCSCPECHKICKKITERKNNLITTSSTSPVVTYATTMGNTVLDNVETY